MNQNELDRRSEKSLQQLQEKHDLDKILSRIDEHIDLHVASPKSSFTLGKRLSWTIGIAASIILLVAIFLVNKSSSSNHFDQYFEPYPDYISLTERSEELAVEESLSMAMIAYRQAEYPLAISMLKAYLRDNQPPNTLEPSFYLGLSYLAEGRSREALIHLLALEGKLPAYEDAIQWYSALAFLKDGDQQEASLRLQKLVDGSDYYKAKAQELLNRL